MKKKSKGVGPMIFAFIIFFAAAAVCWVISAVVFQSAAAAAKQAADRLAYKDWQNWLDRYKICEAIELGGCLVFFLLGMFGAHNGPGKWWLLFVLNVLTSGGVAAFLLVSRCYPEEVWCRILSTALLLIQGPGIFAGSTYFHPAGWAYHPARAPKY